MLVAAYVSYAVHPFKPPTIYLKDVAALTHTIASPKAPQQLPTNAKLRVIPYTSHILHLSLGNDSTSKCKY